MCVRVYTEDNVGYYSIVTNKIKKGFDNYGKIERREIVLLR